MLTFPGFPRGYLIPDADDNHQEKQLGRIKKHTGIIPLSAFSIPSKIRILPCLTALTAGLST